MELREMRGDIYFPVGEGQRLRREDPAPDFTFNELRGGERWRTSTAPIAAGIGGTAMPTWKNVLPDPDLWAMAHYVGRWSRCAARPKPPRCSAACSTSRPGRRPRCPMRAPTARPTASDCGGAARHAACHAKRYHACGRYIATCCFAKSRSAVLETATEMDVGTLTAFHSTENVRLPAGEIVDGPCSSNSRKPGARVDVVYPRPSAARSRARRRTA